MGGLLSVWLEHPDLNRPRGLAQIGATHAAGLLSASVTVQQQLSGRGRGLFFPRWSAKHLRIVDKQGKLVPLVLNHAQRVVYGTELALRRARRRPWIIILKDRKSGISTLAQALAYFLIRTRENAECRTLAHTDDATRKIFGIVDRFYREEQKLGTAPQKSPGSTYALRIPSLGSVYDAVTAGAIATGRGGTLWRIHCSEVAFYVDAEGLHTSLADGQQEGAAYWWESTANGKDGRGQTFYETYQAAKQGKNLFTPIFFPWHAHPSNRLPLLDPEELFPLDPEEEKRVELYGLDLEQVKYWREKRRALSLKGRGLAAMQQEHPDNDEDCFAESGDPYFDRELLAKRRIEDTRPPLRVIEGGPLNGLRVFAEPTEGHEYTMGCDPAEGVDGDDTAISVTDHITGEQVAAWNRNDVDPNHVGKVVLWELGHMYASKGMQGVKPRHTEKTWEGWWVKQEGPAYSVTERNNHGHAVLGAQLERGYPTHRIYKHKEETDPKAKAQHRVGWPNNRATKSVLVADLGESIADNTVRVRDEHTHASIRRIERGPNGVAVLTGRDLAVAHALSLVPPPERWRVNPKSTTSFHPNW